jgi:hypothetical protein
MSEWVVVANFNNIHEASDSVSVLDASGILCELKDTNGYNMMKPFDIVGSTVKLIVREEDSADAIALLLEAGTIKTQDLGPDKSMASLSSFLVKWKVSRSLTTMQNILIYAIAGVVLIALLVLILNNRIVRF